MLPPAATLHDGSWVNEPPNLLLLPSSNLQLVPPIGRSQLEVREQGSPLLCSIKVSLSKRRAQRGRVENGSEEETENTQHKSNHCDSGAVQGVSRMNITLLALLIVKWLWDFQGKLTFCKTFRSLCWLCWVPSFRISYTRTISNNFGSLTIFCLPNKSN